MKTVIKLIIASLLITILLLPLVYIIDNNEYPQNMTEYHSLFFVYYSVEIIPDNSSYNYEIILPYLNISDINILVEMTNNTDINGNGNYSLISYSPSNIWSGKEKAIFIEGKGNVSLTSGFIIGFHNNDFFCSGINLTLNNKYGKERNGGRVHFCNLNIFNNKNNLSMINVKMTIHQFFSNPLLYHSSLYANDFLHNGSRSIELSSIYTR